MPRRVTGNSGHSPSGVVSLLALGVRVTLSHRAELSVHRWAPSRSRPSCCELGSSQGRVGSCAWLPLESGLCPQGKPCFLFGLISRFHVRILLWSLIDRFRLHRNTRVQS